MYNPISLSSCGRSRMSRTTGTVKRNLGPENGLARFSLTQSRVRQFSPVTSRIGKARIHTVYAPIAKRYILTYSTFSPPGAIYSYWNHSFTPWKKDSLHTEILRLERAGIDAVIVVAATVTSVEGSMNGVSLSSVHRRAG